MGTRMVTSESCGENPCRFAPSRIHRHSICDVRSAPDVQKTLKRGGLEVIDIGGRDRRPFSVRNTCIFQMA